MSHSPARNGQLPLLLLMILAATAWSKSPPKQAGDADSVASVAVEQGNSGRLLFPSTHRRVRGSSGEKMIGDLRKALDTVDAARPAVVVPKDLVPLAFSAAQWYCSYVNALQKMQEMGGLECKDYRVDTKGSFHPQLTAADRANGIEDKWCVSVSDVRREPGRPWEDGGDLFRFIKGSGAWKFGSTYAQLDQRRAEQSGNRVQSGHMLMSC